jgi:hypothetical protein
MSGGLKNLEPKNLPVTYPYSLLTLEGDHENFAQQDQIFVSIFELKKPMTLKER